MWKPRWFRTRSTARETMPVVEQNVLMALAHGQGRETARRLLDDGWHLSPFEVKGSMSITSWFYPADLKFDPGYAIHIDLLTYENEDEDETQFHYSVRGMTPMPDAGPGMLSVDLQGSAKSWSEMRDVILHRLLTEVCKVRSNQDIMADAADLLNGDGA